MINVVMQEDKTKCFILNIINNLFYAQEQSLNHESPELIDKISIQREIDQYNQISNENEVIPIKNIQSNNISLQNCFENNSLDVKVDNIFKVYFNLFLLIIKVLILMLLLIYFFLAYKSRK